MNRQELLLNIFNVFDVIIDAVIQKWLYEKIETHTCELIRQEIFIFLMSKGISNSDIRFECYIDYKNNNNLVLSIDKEFMKKYDTDKLNEISNKLILNLA